MKKKAVTENEENSPWVDHSELTNENILQICNLFQSQRIRVTDI